MHTAVAGLCELVFIGIRPTQPTDATSLITLWSAQRVKVRLEAVTRRTASVVG